MIGKFVRAFSEAAHEKGVSDLKFYFEREQKAAAEICCGEVTGCRAGDVTACFAEGTYQGGRGAVYIENFSPELFEEELGTIMQLAILKKDSRQKEAEREKRQEEPVQDPENRRAELAPETGTRTGESVPDPEEGQKRPEVEPERYSEEPVKNSENRRAEPAPEYESMAESLARMTERLLAAERKTGFACPLLRKFAAFSYEEMTRTILLCGDHEESREDRVHFASLRVQAEAEQNGDVSTAGILCFAPAADRLPLEAAVQETAREACDQLHAKALPTGRYPVILKNAVICEMLSMFISAFCADRIHRGLSHFAGRKGEKMASSLVNLLEDPFLAGGVNNRSFDDEGTPVFAKTLIRDGVLRQFLYNRKEAEQDGCESTGNGFKPDCQSPPGIAVTNVLLQGEKKTPEELICQMGDGLFITGCAGMFAGANVVSGDFSLLSKGYRIREGKRAEGVSQITVAGNFFDMLFNIEGLADDYLTTRTLNGSFLAPSVFVGELAVSGL